MVQFPYLMLSRIRMKDLVISATTGLSWDDLEVWAVSLAHSGFNGVKAMIVYDDNQDVISNLRKLDFQVLQPSLQGPVYNRRFLDFHNSVKNSIDNIRYLIATDCRDVYFETDPIAWLETNLKKPFIASSESIQYKNEAWNYGNMKTSFPDFYTRMENKCVYNVGVLAGESRYISDICLSIYLMTQASGHSVSDQSSYNFMLSMEPYASSVQIVSSEDGFACQAGTVADPSKIEKFRPFLLEPEPKLIGGVVTTSQGEIYPIVHQYDRVPEWRTVILDKIARLRG